MRVLLSYMASLKLTFFLLLFLLVSVLVTYNGELSYVMFLLVPFCLLTINLVAAILTHKAFQTNLPLLLFHLTLLATVILVALSRLTYLDGRISLNEGEAFTGQLDSQKSGIFHRYTLNADDFVNLAIELDFTPYVAVTAVRSRVLVQNDTPAFEFVIGEHKPLVINNYRFYVTRNIGYSALFSWQAHSDDNKSMPVATGTINFPPFLTNQLNQTNTWKIPNTDKTLWFMFQPSEDVLAQQQPMQLTPPKDHHLVVRAGEKRQQLYVDGQLTFPEGVLTYHGLRTWMGFKVHYDPFKAYLLMTSILTVLCLSWFFWQKFTKRSWLATLPPS